MTGFATTLPGGVWNDRGPDAPASQTYAVFKVRAGPTTLTSGRLCVQTFFVDLAGYCPISSGAVSVNTVEQLFHDALVSEAANTALLAIALRNAGEKIMAGRLSARRGEYDPSLRRGQDVFVAGLAAELVVQSDRGVT